MSAKKRGFKPFFRRLFLIFRANPEMTGHDGAVGADDEFAQFKLHLSAVQHAGMHKTQVGFTPEFFVVIIHRFLDLDAQRCERVVVVP